MSELFKELSGVINSVAATAEQAADLSNNTLNIAQNGGKVVRAWYLKSPQRVKSSPLSPPRF
jgi:methyl-accepting chemotaxis protein